MEIEQQADAQAADAEVGQALSVVRRHDARDGIDFNDRLPTYENIRAKACVELDAFAHHRNRGLSFNSDPRPPEFMTRADVADRLQHARTGQPMYLDGQTQ